MKKTLWFMVILAVLLPGMALAQEGTSGGPSLGDSYYPELGNGGYDVQHYTLDINYEMSLHLLEGVATIEAVATQNLSDFNLDIIGLMIDTITVNGAPAEHTRERTELTIIPADVLPADEAFTVQIVYAGLPTGIQPEQIPVNMGWNHIGDSVYVASEPVGSSTWYPVNEHPLDKATYTINLTVPEGYESAVTGLRTAETINDDGSISTTWELSAPTASYLVSINIGDFVRVEEEGPDGLLIRNYFPPDIVDEAVYDFGRTAEMIEYFSRLYGPYPFDVYGVVVTDNDTGFALENQTLSLFGIQHVDGTRSSELTVAHELAHQWFGDSVTLSDWSDIWLNEGFATYSQFLWLEHSAGEAVFNEQMEGIYAYLVPMSAALPPIGTPPPNNLFNGAVYLRGAMTLHALRHRVGEETGIAIMQTYFDTYRNSNTTTADFIAIAEEVSGQDLADFFDSWLYQQALPPIPELGWAPNTIGD